MKQQNTFNITIDTGTTNTRVILWGPGRKKLQEEKRTVGVGNTAQDGNNSKLKAAIKECLEHIVEEQKISWEEIGCIAASGMITSNLGLVEIPHLTAPAGILELAQNVTRRYLPDIAPVPITFIPGVKNRVSTQDLSTLLEMDIMRGEEVEAVAVLKDMEAVPMLLVLPGSHTKFVFTDDKKRILACLTSMTGELLAFLIMNSIAADAAGRTFVTDGSYDAGYVQWGYETAEQEGAGRAAFSARIMNQFYIQDKTKVGNFLMGIALENDIKLIKNALQKTMKNVKKPEKVIVAGSSITCRALFDLLRKNVKGISVELFKEDSEVSLSAQGVFAVMKMFCDSNESIV